MNIFCKHNVGDNVYYLDVFEGKIKLCFIDAIEIKTDLNSVKTTYYVKDVIEATDNDEEESEFTASLKNAINFPKLVNENLIFDNRSDALDFAIKITEDIK